MGGEEGGGGGGGVGEREVLVCCLAVIENVWAVVGFGSFGGDGR